VTGLIQHYDENTPLEPLSVAARQRGAVPIILGTMTLSGWEGDRSVHALWRSVRRVNA